MTKRVGQFRVLATVSLLAVAACCGSAEAAVAFDNLGSEPYTTIGYGSFGLTDGTAFYDRGMQFTASETITLSTLELALGQSFLSGFSSPGQAQVQLMTDTSGTPGTLIESWTSPTLAGPSPAAGRVETFTSVVTPTLAAGTKYWIVLSAAPGSNLAGAWYFADNEHTGNTRVMYGETGGSSPGYATLTRGYRTRVSGDLVIPEPASAALAAIGGLLILARRR